MGCVIFMIRPLFSTEQLKYVSFLTVLLTIILLFWCCFDKNALAVLSYIFRSSLNNFLVQFLFSLCVKLEILLLTPFFVIRLVWLSLFFSLFFLALLSYYSFSHGLFIFEQSAVDISCGLLSLACFFF